MSTRVLSPGKAVIWAAFFNFVAAFAFGTAVASTVGKGMIDIRVVTFGVILAGLIGAIAWDLLTWYLRPADQLVARADRRIRRRGGGEGRVGRDYRTRPTGSAGGARRSPSSSSRPWSASRPGWLLMVAIYWIFRRMTPWRVDQWFRRLQLVSAALFSLNHGANDAQKTMGIITGVLFAAGYLKVFEVPFWVILAAHAAIGLGTLAGGWRIIHTMGSRITKLQPVNGFAAETGAASAIFLATALGIPVSTTHAITGAIVGVGATRRLSAVRWGVAGRIVWAWVLTIPAAALIGASTYVFLRFVGMQ